MDRRFVTWLMLTTALFFLWLSFRQPPPEVEPNLEEQAINERADIDPLLSSKPSDKGAPQSEQLPGEPDPAAPASDKGTAAEAKPEPFPSRVITLGSMDPSKGYRLQVTLTSKGGGVERAELVEQTKPGRFRYRALEFEKGYLGYLGAVDASSGVRVRTVPDGSAANTATCNDAAGGILVDDVITSINDQPVDSTQSYFAALRETSPGDEIRVAVNRQTEGATTSLTFNAVLTQAPLDVIRMRMFESEYVSGNRSRPSLLTTLASINSTKIPAGMRALPALSETLTTDWEVRALDVEGGEGVEFRLPLGYYLQNTGRPSDITIVKQYRLFPAGDKNPDGFTLDFETKVVNNSDEEISIATRQEGLSGLTLEGWWYSVKISPSFFSGAGQRDVMHANSIPNSHSLSTTREIYGRATDKPKQPDIIMLSENEPLEVRSLEYIGLDSQYFTGSILPHPDQPDSLSNLQQAGAMAVADVSSIEKSRSQATNTSFWFDTQEEPLAAGAERSQRYQIYVGPKDGEVLAKYGLSRAIEYGWFPWIAKPLSGILHFFHAIVRNYGLAIVLLTLMVRGAMFPLGRKAAMNAQRMQELQPELKKINDKYKDNMEKRAKAMQDLYAKHNFKPLAGCLPMFIQLPIFIGLYRCLSVDISLRQEPLIPGISWCNNLAAPDQLINWSTWMPEFIAGRGTGWLGPYFNILPMATVGLFLLQQKMLMPKATDEQTRVTQNMMQIMTIFMGVLFFKVPSGLCIYFITSSAWSLIERKLVKRLAPPSALNLATEKVASTDPKSPRNGKNSGSRRGNNRDAQPAKPQGKFQELMKMLEKPSVKSATQRDSQKPKKRRK